MSDTNLKHNIVIIGFGRFGSLLHKILIKQDLNVTVVSLRPLSTPGVKELTLAEALMGGDIIIPCVPISEFENCIQEITRLLPKNSDAIVVDVCSIKQHPAEIMLETLPKNIGVIATHPVWGPNSSENGTALVGLRFIFQILRDNGNTAIHSFLKLWQDLGQEMVEMTPQSHDQETAFSHAFAFLVGEIGLKLNIHHSFTTTKGLEGLLYNQNVVAQESKQLFQDMFTYNPFAMKMLDEFIEVAQTIKQELIIKT